jgi:hypothetical protein
LVALLDEEDLAAEVPAHPDDGPHCRVHALRVVTGVYIIICI